MSPRPPVARRRTAAGLVLALLLTLLAVPQTARAATLPPDFSDSVVATVSRPTKMEMAPDGRLFVSEQGGGLRIVKNGALLPTPFMTIDVDSNSERGLLGVAFDPGFTTNGWVYAFYTAKTPTVHNRVSRFTANGDVVVPGSEQVIVDFDTLGAGNHNAGTIHFGPDGKLYVTQGDNAGSAQAQSLTSRFGKILRYNADGSIPADNPFFSETTGANRAIWALGLRNPYAFTFQPGTGRMLINDVGQDTWEEVNEGTPGANYGWPTTEGPTTDPRFNGPLFAYQHDGDVATTGCAITGGEFYNPATPAFPAAFMGQYLYADYCSQWVRRLDPPSATATSFATGAGRVVDLEVAADGSVYVLAHQDSGPGVVRRITYGGSLAPVVTTPPAAQTVAVGDPATFTVSASGTPPLAYQWQRNGSDIAGATGATYTIASASLADHGASFRARVSNTAGSTTSAAAVLTVLDNAHPVATITAPAEGARYNAGTVITFAGTGADEEDGTLPPAGFTWEVVFHHEAHTHPFLGPVTGTANGTFTIPTTGETSADVFYRLHLTVRDSVGLTHRVFRDLRPNTVTVSLASVPPGLQVALDGQPRTTPFSVTSVVGMARTLGAPSPQDAGGKRWQFASWSDGGAATHPVTTPSTAVTYTATFTERAGVSFRSSSWNGSSSGRTSMTLATPAGTAAGDVMLASVTVNDDEPGLQTPAGWTLVRQDAISDRLRQAVYVRVASASEPGSHQWRLSGTPERRLAGGIATYRNVDTASPVDAHAATVDTTADTTVEAPSVTTTLSGAGLVVLAAVNAEGTLSPPPGMTERWEAASPNLSATRDALTSASDAVLGTAGPTGGRAVSTGAAGVHIGATVALRPRPGGGGGGGISFRAATSNGFADGRQTITLARPAGTTAGDVLVASVVVNDDEPGLVAPAGWSLVREGSVVDKLRHAVYVRVAGGSEPSGYTWSLTTDYRRLAGGIVAYSGVSAASPVLASGVTTLTNSAPSIDAPSLDVPVAGARLLQLSGINAEGSVSPPFGMSERYDVSSPNTTAARDALAEASDRPLSSTGPTGPSVASASHPGPRVGISLALRPATG